MKGSLFPLGGRFRIRYDLLDSGQDNRLIF